MQLDDLFFFSHQNQNLPQKDKNWKEDDNGGILEGRGIKHLWRNTIAIVAELQHCVAAKDKALLCPEKRQQCGKKCAAVQRFSL